MGTYLDDLPLRADRGAGSGEPSLQAGGVGGVISIGTGLKQNHLHKRSILGESGTEGSGDREEHQDHRVMDTVGAAPCWNHHLAGWICADRDIISHGRTGQVAVTEIGVRERRKGVESVQSLG